MDLDLGPLRLVLACIDWTDVMYIMRNNMLLTIIWVIGDTLNCKIYIYSIYIPA